MCLAIVAEMIQCFVSRCYTTLLHLVLYSKMNVLPIKKEKEIASEVNQNCG